jgi:FMN phosphatase YigB (HAD superfamily)
MILNLVLDFDGTIADTFQPSPNKIGVGEAYCLAVEKLFGKKDGKNAFYAVGGLQNRAPIELINVFREYGLNTGNLEDTAEKLVSAKMEVLLGEISPNWPLSCQGYKQFNSKINQLRQDGVDLKLAILSSGHTEFIKKTFSVWEQYWNTPIFWPDIIVSDDDLRNLKMPVAQKVKPSSFLFDLVKEQMGEGNYIYFGDDPEKDGRLALNSGIPFGWFADNENKKPLPADITPLIKFADWRKIDVEKL